MMRASNRRQFLMATSAFGCVASAMSLRASMLVAAPPTDATSKIQLLPAAHNLFRIRLEMSLDGNVNMPKNSLISKERASQLPIRATSVIDYEELLTRNEKARPVAARRYYYEAESESTISGRSTQNSLRKQARNATAYLSNGPAIIVGDKEFLTHEEIELLHTPVSSLAVDALLPTEAVEVGSTWSIENNFLPSFFNLDAIQSSQLVGEIVAIEPAQAKLQIKGRIDGSIEGVPTALDVAGKITFDRKTNSVSWLAVAVREIREIGKARPGFEVGATIKMIRQSLDKPNVLTQPEPIDIAKGVPAKQMVVQIESYQGGFNAFMDRDWRVISDAAGLTTLRMVVGDKAISQCDIRPLTNLKAGEQLTIEAFQAEVKKSLDQRFGEFIEAEEGLNGSGLRTMRVSVQGQVQDVPVQWVFLQFSDDTGRRVGATFTVESAQVETFGGSDAQLANSFLFKPKSGTLQATSTDSQKR